MKRPENRARRAMLDRLAFSAWSAHERRFDAGTAQWNQLPRDERDRWIDVVRVVFTRFAEFEVSP